MRLSMIGAAATELTAAATGAAAYGVELGGEGYDIYAMANSLLTMAVNGCGWLAVVALLTPRMESIRQKIGGGDSVLLGIITASASIGLFAYMASQYYIQITQIPANAWACIAGTVIMFACVKFSSKAAWLILSNHNGRKSAGIRSAKSRCGSQTSFSLKRKNPRSFAEDRGFLDFLRDSAERGSDLK